jgi:hypothetical protein
MNCAPSDGDRIWSKCRRSADDVGVAPQRTAGLTAQRGPENRVPLADRAAEARLPPFVSRVDILLGIGWLDPGAQERGRRGQIDCLESVVHAIWRPSRMPCRYCCWATAQGLAVARRCLSRTRRNARRKVSAEAVILRSKPHTGHVGFRRTFPRRGARDWRKEQAEPGTGDGPVTPSGHAIGVAVPEIS